MIEGDPISRPKSIVDRAKAIILKPKEEWPVIDLEPATISSLFKDYALILAAIPAVALLIGGQVFGYSILGASFRPSLMSSISLAVTQYVFALLGVALLAFIIDFLAPNFGGTSNRIQAFKVAVYSATAGWLAGIFSLIPSLSALGIVGLYSLYLLYTGLPVLMKSPADKSMTYTIVTVICGAVVGIVLYTLLGLIMAPIAMIGGGAIGPMAGTESGTVTIPGMGDVDLDKMKASAAKMEEAAKKMEVAAKTGQSGAVDPSALQAFLPGAIGGYKRTEISSAGLGAGGSHAEARYEAGDHNFRVEITDMAAMGALAGMGAAMNVNSSRQTETGYEKTQTVNGQIVTEEWDKGSNNGKFGTTVANRFMVEANGSAASIDELKAAVAAVGPEKLAALAK
ncbi:MAG TPA: Yip1 family protein [Sphingobium sp.]